MKHVLLLVGSKVLAICGRSPQLPTADLLLIILMTSNLYKHDSILQGQSVSHHVDLLCLFLHDAVCVCDFIHTAGLI